MNPNELTKWREECTSDLRSIKTDVEWIKKSVDGISQRTLYVESQVAWLKGVGFILPILLAGLLSLVVSLAFSGCEYTSTSEENMTEKDLEEEMEFDPADWIIF